MGIFTRFKDIVTSNISSMLDSAEDPEKLIRLMLREMEETLVELKSGCAASMAEASKVRRDLEQAEGQVLLWERRTELAISAKREDMAQEAVEQCLDAKQRIEHLVSELAGFDEMITKCREDIQSLEERIQATKDKQRLLTDRHSQAQLRHKARQKVREADTLNSMQRFSDLEQRIQRMEYEADLAYTPVKPSFQDLERQSTIQQELDRIKAKMGQGNQ